MRDIDIEQLISDNHYDRVCGVVDLGAISHNMDAMRKRLSGNPLMMGVIKTNGYGHGSIPIALMLQKKDYVYGFAAATYEEALMLREAGVTLPIMILGYTFPYCYEGMIRKNIRPTAFRYDQLQAFTEASKKAGRPISIHIAVDTGMGRIGITPDEKGVEFVKKALSTEGVVVEGIFTHFSKADELDKSFAKTQIERFVSFVERAEKETGVRIPLHHASNSAGIVELPDAHLDMVRAGITLYGLWPSEEVDKSLIDLQPALSLISHIVYIKEVEAGTPISYGGTFVSEKKMHVATIPVGYGDGYPRSLSNVGYVLIRGKKAPILGRVCMDQFMVDVTDILDATEGDQVVLVGRQGDEEITMEALGEMSGRFNYELACDMNERIPRLYLNDIG